MLCLSPPTATETYGPSHDKEGFQIDYSITENGGPFRRPTLYHNDYRLVKNSTYGQVLPPGHSENWPPGTSDSVLKAQRVPENMNTRNPLASSTTIGVAPEISVQAPAPAPAALDSSRSGGGGERPQPEALHGRRASTDSHASSGGGGGSRRASASYATGPSFGPAGTASLAGYSVAGGPREATSAGGGAAASHPALNGTEIYFGAPRHHYPHSLPIAHTDVCKVARSLIIALSFPLTTLRVGSEVGSCGRMRCL